jgi:hypothetical protein
MLPVFHVLDFLVMEGRGRRDGFHEMCNQLKVLADERTQEVSSQVSRTVEVAQAEHIISRVNYLCIWPPISSNVTEPGSL